MVNVSNVKTTAGGPRHQPTRTTKTREGQMLANPRKLMDTPLTYKDDQTEVMLIGIKPEKVDDPRKQLLTMTERRNAN